MMTGSRMKMGPTAVLEINPPDSELEEQEGKPGRRTTVVVTSYRQQILDPCILRGQGVEPLEFGEARENPRCGTSPRVREEWIGRSGFRRKWTDLHWMW